jgi:hypothetical protein
VTARLHQPTQSIHLLRSSPRAFTQEHWRTVQERLEAWRGSVDAIIETVDATLGVRREGGVRGDEVAAAAAARVTGGGPIVVDDDEDGLVVEPVAVEAH